MKLLALYLTLPLTALLFGCGGPSAPRPAATADAAVMQVVNSLKNNDPTGPWHMLPESYQQDMNGLLHDFADAMDEDLWQNGARLLSKLENVLTSKKDLILANQTVQTAPMAGDIHSNYDHLTDMLGILNKSDITSLDNLRNADIGRLLSTTGADLMNKLSQMESAEIPPQFIGRPQDNTPFELHDQLDAIQAELVSEDGDSAVVRISDGTREPEEIPFVRVEGKWIPLELNEEFPAFITEGQTTIESLQITPEVKSQILMGMTMAEGMLDQLQAAETQQEMQSILGGLMGTMGGM